MLRSRASHVSARSADLLAKGPRLCEQTMTSIEKTEVAIARFNDQLERSRFRLHQHTKRRASMSLLPFIRLRLREGGLPHDSGPIILGRPGVAGVCDACGKVLRKKRLVMDIPSGDHVFVHLHANCYIFWKSERHKAKSIARSA